LLTLPATAQQPASVQPPVDLGQLLLQLQQTAAQVNASLGQLRIEKWKTDSQGKNQYQANAESIQRNISGALPGMMDAVRTSPENLSASFKLYRNVGALYDVLASLTEAAGAFGPKDDYRDLAQQLQQLDGVRHAMADRLEQLATVKDAELSRLRAQVRPAATAPRKIIVDDNEPAKPAKKKKKSAATTAESGSRPQ